jgi:hypothetical protein
LAEVNGNEWKLGNFNSLSPIYGGNDNKTNPNRWLKPMAMNEKTWKFNSLPLHLWWGQ